MQSYPNRSIVSPAVVLGDDGTASINRVPLAF